jgi:ubiquinone/menaquinone biosynthesis C-methylase UbiE
MQNKSIDTEQFEIVRPQNSGRLYKFLIDYKIRVMTELLGRSLQGLELLDVCCGSGMEAQYFAAKGAEITALDYSAQALERAKKRASLFGFEIKTVRGDTQNLPFENNSFDFAFTHDGLHHLPDPKKGIKEMARVSRNGIFFSEPADALITRLAVKMGLALEFEEEGNYVYRFSINELRKLFSELGFENMKFKRYGMWYPHRPSGWFKLFDYSPALLLYKGIFHASNVLASRFGNKLASVAFKTK